MKKAHRIALVLSTTMLSLVSQRASAGPIFFGDEAAFNAAVSAPTTTGFPAVNSVLGPSYTLGPVTFSGSNMVLYNDSIYPAPYLGTSESLISISSTSSALGLVLGSNWSESIRITVGDSGGVMTVSPSAEFLGIINDGKPISLTLSNDTGLERELDILRITTGSAMSAAVPEPATWAMMLLGFGGIGFAMQRKRITARATA